MSTGVGFIGAGWAVRKIHLPFFLQRADAGPIVLFDPSDEATRAVRGLDSRIRIATSLDDLLARRDVKVVVVASPSHWHVEHSLRSLAAGRAVICEKPISIDARQLEHLERYLSHPGHSSPQPLFFACTPNRFRADVSALRDVVRRGLVGTPYRIEARWLRARGVPGPSWFRERAQSGGGALIDLGPHLIDVVLWLSGLGEPRTVSGFVSASFWTDRGRTAAWHRPCADGGAAHTPVEDNASVFLRFENACSAVHVGWAGHHRGDTTEIQIFGDAGQATLTTVFGFSTDTQHDSGSLVLRTAGAEEYGTFPLGERTAPHHAMLGTYLEHIEKGIPAERHEVLTTMKIIHAVYEQAHGLSQAKDEPHASRHPTATNVRREGVLVRSRSPR